MGRGPQSADRGLPCSGSLHEGGPRQRRVLAHPTPDDFAVAEGEMVDDLGLLECLSRCVEGLYRNPSARDV